MQFKRPLNVAKTRKKGVSSYVNSFQFLRANKLVLSVKSKELVNGWEILPELMARCKDAPLTAQEVADWKEWKRAHDKEELIDTNVARFRQAAEQVPTMLLDACHALQFDLVTHTAADISAQWEALDAYVRAMEKKGYKRPTLPCGRPKTPTEASHRGR